MPEATVTRYVRRRSELGLLEIEVTVPQTHLPAAEAEEDFGEVYAVIGGEMTKCWMFVMRLSHSGRACHVVFGTQAQKAFFEGHVRAFEWFGGVPHRIRYDNLKPAVVRVLRGRDRVGYACCPRAVTLPTWSDTAGRSRGLLVQGCFAADHLAAVSSPVRGRGARIGFVCGRFDMATMY